MGWIALFLLLGSSILILCLNLGGFYSGFGDPPASHAPYYTVACNLISYSIGTIGVLITGYYAFAVSGAIPDSEFLNLGLLSQAERGAVFGLCLVGLGGIIAVINK